MYEDHLRLYLAICRAAKKLSFDNIFILFVLIYPVHLQKANQKTKMKIPTLSVLSIFALLGMALGMGYGYGSYGGFGAQYVPVPVGYGGQSNPLGIGQGGICK